ncbi:hypothetical protein C8J38_105156 [Rhizobium sp. PP-WC-2G-219]|nr:hypothetical protein C8J38_105156 [Rhizobium sp. PP-WC-2G-219]
MILMPSSAAREIFDNICKKIHGKRASAWTFRAAPFAELETYAAWQQEANDAKNESSRSDAFLFGYVLFTGGTIPMRGIRFSDGYVRPDVWVVGSLIKSGRLQHDDTRKIFEVTEHGWERISYLSESLIA